MAEPEEPGVHDADRLIARALESVLETIPGPPGGDLTPPEQNPTAQPWAETAAPPGRNKRPLETLLEEYSARVAAAPGAVAGHPSEKPPAEAYLESLSAAAAPSGKRASKRRWHGGQARGGR